MIIDGHSQKAFGIILPNDILVKELFYLNRFWQITQVQWLDTIFLTSSHGFLRNFIRLGSTAVTDKSIQARNQETDFVFRTSTKATSISIFLRIRHITF